MNAVSPQDQSFDLFSVPLGGIIRASHEAIVVIDEQQVVVALNPAAQEMFGCTAEQALGSSLARFIPAASRRHWPAPRSQKPPRYECSPCSQRCGHCHWAPMRHMSLGPFLPAVTAKPSTAREGWMPNHSSAAAK